MDSSSPRRAGKPLTQDHNVAESEARMRVELVEAWLSNQRINLYLLEGISERGLRCSLSTRGGRDVARQ